MLKRKTSNQQNTTQKPLYVELPWMQPYFSYRPPPPQQDGELKALNALDESQLAITPEEFDTLIETYYPTPKR